jgi:hypothetical protein
MTARQWQTLFPSPLISRVLLPLSVLLTSWLLTNVSLQAENKPHSLDIRVQVNGFGAASSADLTALLQSVAFQIWRHCPLTELSGIDVYHRTDHPQTNSQRTPSGRIAIGLAAQDAHWAQYSFQFAHEFCHALANFSNHQTQRSVRTPSPANFWLEETLCETASLFTLRAMSRSWLTAPPFPVWRDYAPWLNGYAQQRLTLPENQLPPGKSFSVWFREHHSALRGNSTIRNWNTIIAIQLLPIFESAPRRWETVTFLNDNTSHEDESLARHFAEWRSRCPEDLRPFVRKLATVFDIDI